jgi:hypothetical protein
MHLNVITQFNAQFISSVQIFPHNFLFIPDICRFYFTITREIFEENMYQYFNGAIVTLKPRTSSQENNNKDNIVKFRVQEKISELAEQSGVTCYIFGHTALKFIAKELEKLIQCHFMIHTFKQREIYCAQIFCNLTSALFWVIKQPIVVNH